jgi:hypothetical protein
VKKIWPGLLLLLAQLLIVLSIAGKYLYERQTRPRVWSRAVQADPSLPLRGRYLALNLVLDACGLLQSDPAPQYPRGSLRLWHVSLTTRDGKLIPHNEGASSSSSIGTVLLPYGKPCDRATLTRPELLFIPDRVQLPPPLRPGPLKQDEEIWVEVTVPSHGPPRPIRIALSSADGFHPLNLD